MVREGQEIMERGGGREDRVEVRERERERESERTDMRARGGV